MHVGNCSQLALYTGTTAEPNWGPSCKLNVSKTQSTKVRDTSLSPYHPNTHLYRKLIINSQ